MTAAQIVAHYRRVEQFWWKELGRHGLACKATTGLPCGVDCDFAVELRRLWSDAAVASTIVNWLCGTRRPAPLNGHHIGDFEIRLYLEIPMTEAIP